MNMTSVRLLLAGGLGAVLLGATPALAAPKKKTIVFNRDIRPILSEHCFACHGPDEKKRKAKLRLDINDKLFDERKGGVTVLVPGDLVESELYANVTTDDEDTLMPPADHDKPLSGRQKELIGQWIKEGAQWQEHWSFMKPVRPKVPQTKHAQWAKNPIDHFIAAKLEEQELPPSKEANRETLIRRVAFDLTGLPPTLQETDRFLADKSADWYGKMIDHYMASPRYGEHVAHYWLDAVRYGDTHGLHLDNVRSIWPYRDWVIRALNANMPYDQFSIAQLAGDLLPNPTQDQQVASAYVRAHVSTSEGGAIPEEWYVRYAVDRTETMGAIWMGMTVGCGLCHEHKFDPISQKEFYQMFAFFNNSTESAMDGNKALWAPVLKLDTPEQKSRKAALDKQITVIEKNLLTAVTKVKYEEPKNVGKSQPKETVWIDDTVPPKARAQGDSPWKFVSKPEPVFCGSKASLREAKGRSQHFFTGANPTLAIGTNTKLFAHVYLDTLNPPKEIMLQFNDGTWEHRAYWGGNKIDFGKDKTVSRKHMGDLPETGKWIRLEVDASKVGLKPGAQLNGWAFTQFDGKVYWDKAGITTTVDPTKDPQLSLKFWTGRNRNNKGLPGNVQAALKADPAKRNDAQKTTLRSYYLAHVHNGTSAQFSGQRKQIAALKKQKTDIDKSAPSTMVMKEMAKPRPSYVLKRGEYDKKGEQVTANIPGFLPQLAKLEEKRPYNRLDLARWLMRPEHPLTARVTVNRLWQQYFGVGIVRTSEDFGSQGEPPTHPDLLDWMATELVAMKWNVKQFQKLLLTSAAYRQSSSVTPAMLEVDPENRFYARGPRFRLDAESLRDNALAVSGLLVDKLGGTGVKPYQPQGIWKAVGYSGSNTVKYQQGKGPDQLYRRSLYTFWKRTAPPPSMITFDAPSREIFCMRRERTNTPMQALLMMNDPQFVEAARHLGVRLMSEGGKTAAQRLAWGFRLVLTRKPNPREVATLEKTLGQLLAKFKADPEAAKQLLSVGDSEVNTQLDPGEQAAYAMISSLLLNLDETVTKN